MMNAEDHYLQRIGLLTINSEKHIASLTALVEAQKERIAELDSENKALRDALNAQDDQAGSVDDGSLSPMSEQQGDQ